MKKILVTAAALLISLNSYAANPLETLYSRYSTISEPVVTLIEEQEEDYNVESLNTFDNCEATASHHKVQTSPTVVISSIINIGKMLWPIIEKNKPKVNLQEEVATALPQGINCWQDLSQWKTPKSRTYKVKYENLYGITVVEFNYKVLFTYGGSYKGQGAYMTNISVLPQDVSTLWGYELNSKVKIDQVVNMGTEENPVAGVGTTIKWQIKTPLNERNSSVHYFMNGLGTIKKL